jgi:hypothetical protein
MSRGTKLALIPAFVPALALTLGLPFVNRIQPVILGLPLLLFWITAWVAATPLFLLAAYVVERRVDGAAARGGEGNR